MATSGNRIRVDVDVVTNVDKNALSSLQQQLDKLVVQGKVANLGDNINQGLVNAGKEAEKLRDILDQSWNSKLNQLDFTKVNNSIHQTWGSAQNLGNALAQGGKKGAEAFANLTSTVLNTNIQLKQSSKILDQFATTFKNTVRYGISSSIFNNLTNSIQKAYNYTKQLDTSLNDIRIVSSKTADDMERFAVQANKAAKALGQSTLDYTNASLIYYQQGLSDDEVEARTNVTLKAANVTGQTAQEVSEQLTAVWNGYNVTVQQSEEYIDKLAAVAASTAADLEELSTGMSKVASAANAMGVPIDQLNAQLATIVSVTRQAPESVGTALRTIYARMGDIEAGLDSETTLGNYTAQMKELGVNVLDADGNLRDMGDVITEVGNNWKNMSREQQVALAQIMAGTRQYNNLLALFGNWDMYNEALQTSLNSAGELQRQQDIYMESTRAHLQQLQTEAEKTYSILFDQDSARGFIDIINGALGVLNDYLTGLGGGMRTLITLGLQISNLFSQQIGQEVTRVLQNQAQQTNAVEASKTKEDFLQAYYGKDFNIKDVSEPTKKEIDAQYEVYRQIQDVKKVLSEEDAQQLTTLQKQTGELTKQIELDKINLQKTRSKYHVPKETQDTQDYMQNQLKMWEGRQESYNYKHGSNSKDIQKQIDYWKKGLKEVSDVNEDIIEQKEKQLGWTKEEVEKQLELKRSEQDIMNLNKAQSAILSSLFIGWGAVSTLLNKDLSSEEKFKSILADILVLTVTLGKNWKAIGSTVKLLPQFFEGFSKAFKSGGNVLEAASNKAIDKSNKDIIASEKEKQKEKAKSMAQVPAVITGNNTEIASDKALAEANRDVAQSEKEKQAAKDGKNISEAADKDSKAFQQLGLNAGMLVKNLLPVIAVLAGIAAICGIVYLAVTKDERAMNKASEAVDKAKESYNKASEANQEFQSTMSEYQSGIDGLKGLEKGTLEYYNAILKANEAAQELIDKNNLIAGMDYTVSSDGLININEDALKTAAFSQQQNVFRAQANVYSKTNDVVDLKIKENNKETAKAIENAIKEQTGEFYQISADQANAWLNGEGMDVIETIDSNLKRNTVVTQQGSVDITEAITEGFAKNKELEAERDQNLLLEAQAAIQGYSTQEQFEQYSELSEIQKQAINSVVAEEFKQNAAQNEPKTGKDVFTEDTARGIGWGLSTVPFGLGVLGVAAGAGTAIGGIINKNVYENQLKREYLAQNRPDVTLGSTTHDRLFGMTEEEYFLADKEGVRLSKDREKELLDSISMDEIYNALDKGYTETEDILDNHLDKLKKVSYDVANEIDTVTGKFRFDQESQNYISAAITAATSGMQDSFDYSLLSSDELEYVQEKLKEYNIELGDVTPDAAKRAAADLAAYNNILKSQAQALDTTDKALKIYGAVMRDANGNVLEFNETNANLIAADYKFNKVFNEGVEVFNNNEDAFEQWIKAMRKDGEKVPYDVADAVGELQIKLEEMLGYEVNPDFLNRYAGDIKKLFSGTADEAEAAYARIQEAALSDTLMTSLGMTTDQISGLLNELSSLEPGAALSDSWNTSLQEMINNAKLTEEQVRAIFENAHIQMPTPDDYELSEETATSEATITKRTYVGQIPKISSTLFSDMQVVDYVPVNYTVTETAEPVQQKYFKFKGQNVTLRRDRTAKGAAFGTAKSASNFKQSIKNSSSGSKDKPKMEEPLKAELDRYHDVDVQLELFDKRLAKLQKSQEKAFGQNLIDNYTEQIKLLNKQIDVTNQKLAIAKREQSELQSELAKLGVTFAADGSMSNYFDVYVAQYEKYLAVVNKYNSLATATQQEKFKSSLDAAKEEWEQFLSNTERYDELITSFIPELEAEMQDKRDEIVEKQIEEFKMAIEIHLELAEATREWNEFKRKVIDSVKDTDILGNAKASLTDFYTYLNDANTGTIQKLTEQVNKTLDQLHQFDQYGEADWYGDNQAQMVEDLKNYYSQLMEEQENLVDLQEQIHEYYLDMMDEVQDRFDRQIESYEIINDLIEHNMNVIQMVYGEDAYSKLGKYYAQQEENNNKQLDFQRQQAEFWERVMNESEKGSEAWDKARENWESAVSDLNNLIEQSIETLQDKYLNSINEIFKNLNEKYTNGKGLDYIEEEWELINKNSEQYLDNIDAEWAIQKLQGKYLDALDQTDSITAQRQIRDAMNEQLQLLREKDKLSQYDVDRANQMYDILLKQIALQEAQQNKSRMRLRRDSQGNYSYQFVADDDQTGQLQDELGDLYNSLYDFDKEHYIENLNNIYEIWVEFQEKMTEAAQINDPVKRAEMELLIREQYEPLMNALLEQNLTIRNNLQQSAFDDLNYLYQDSTIQFLEMTEAEKWAFLEDLIPAMQSGIRDLAESIAGEGGFIPTVESSLVELDERTAEYEASLNQLAETAGVDFEQMREGMDQNIDKTQEVMDKNDELIDQLGDELQAVADVCAQVDELMERYDAANRAAQQATQDAYEYFQTVKSRAAEAAESVKLIESALSDVSRMVDSLQAKIDRLNSSYSAAKTKADSYSGGGSGGGGNRTVTDYVPKNTTTTNTTSKTNDSYLTEQWVTSPAILKSSPYLGVYLDPSGKTPAVKNRNMPTGNLPVLVTQKASTVGRKDILYPYYVTLDGSLLGMSNKDIGWVSANAVTMGRANLSSSQKTSLKDLLKKFDTGGYTGEWGSDGKLAMLHQKELVLNATDTKNILNAVSAIRGLSSSMLSQLAAVSANTSTGSLDNAFEQNVHITATFPNVVSSHEVEDAINNLVNVATQRVGQRR